MSEPKVECPCCGGEMALHDIFANKHWTCICGFCGPGEDPDGLQVRRLIQLPDPTQSHDDLKGWQCREMCKRFGGQWRAVEDGFPWTDQAMSQCAGDIPRARYSWRPSAPKPVERRTGPYTIAEIVKWDLDGKSRWAEHPHQEGKHRLTANKKWMRCWCDPNDGPSMLGPGMLAGWYLVELVPAEEGE